MAFQVVLSIVFFSMMNTRDPMTIYIALSLGLAIGHGAVFGAQGAMFSELFPARIRYSGLSLVQQIGPILGGGLSPLIATALLAETGGVAAVVAFMVGSAVLSALCTLGLKRYKNPA